MGLVHDPSEASQEESTESGRSREVEGRIRQVFECMLSRFEVEVITETRTFRGLVFDMGTSPYSNETTAGVVDDEGRVHYFRIDRASVECVLSHQN